MSGAPWPGPSSGSAVRGLNEQKLKAFSIGNMGNKRIFSKKASEEAKRKLQEEETAKVYHEFVSTFDESGKDKLSKTWVKAGTFDAGSRREDDSDKGKIYAPMARNATEDIKPAKPALSKRELKRPEKPGKSRVAQKRKSNLELFKEELKAIQEEREERHRIKEIIKSGGSVEEASRSTASPSLLASSAVFDGSHDVGDPTTTNIYLGNINPEVTEQELMEFFGKFGALASVKIMWPRTDDEKSRGRHSGFVAFMSRKDAERAYSQVSGTIHKGFEVKMGWGKPVPLPLYPIYVPPALAKLTLPPPPSGLPFNCQPLKKEDSQRWEVGTGKMITPSNETEKAEFDEMLKRCYVKVVIPSDRSQLCLINRMVEFVVREGPVFEAMIMSREVNNRHYNFLFENKTPEHIYYRWRLFSLLQGDSKESWREREFRMYKDGPIWRPPPINLFTDGMPDHLIHTSQPKKSESREKSEKRESSKKKGANQRGLSNTQRDKFEDMLRNLVPDRNPIAEAMVWCLEHADAGEEIVECLCESLSILETPVAKKVARLYLVSDILHNCSVKGVPNVSFYRQGFQAKLPEIFADLCAFHEAIEGRLRAEAFKQRVMSCFRAWEDWALYPQDFLIRLQNTFLGLLTKEQAQQAEQDRRDELERQAREEEDVDGVSMSDEDEDVDGVPLDGDALLKAATLKKSKEGEGNNSFINNQKEAISAQTTLATKSTISSSTTATTKALPAGFVPSKWETVEPEEVQAQAVTSRWDHLFSQNKPEDEEEEAHDDDDDDLDGVPMDEEAEGVATSRMDPSDSAGEERRARLRQVELEVVQYQDELEAGKHMLSPGWTLSEQVDHFRKKLLKQVRLASQETSDTPTHRSDMATPPANDDYLSDESNSGSRRDRRGRRSDRRRRNSDSSRSRSRERGRKKKRRRDDDSSSDDDHRRRRSKHKKKSNRH